MKARWKKFILTLGGNWSPLRKVMEWNEPELIQEKPRKDKKGRRNKHKGKKKNTKATTTTTTKTETTTATLIITQQAHAESITKLPTSDTTHELPVSSSKISSTSTSFLLTDNVSETSQSSETISSFQNVTIDSYLSTWEATAPSSSIELLTGAETTSSVESSSGRARTRICFRGWLT